jgi:hypothetical protein
LAFKRGWAVRDPPDLARPLRLNRPDIEPPDPAQVALAAVRAFDELYGAKWPRATAKITDDAEELLAFYDYAAQHWIHLRTTNPIESTSPRSGTGPRSPNGAAPRPPGSPWHSS